MSTNTQRLYKIADNAFEAASATKDLLARNAIAGAVPSPRVYEYQRNALALELVNALTDLIENEGAKVPPMALENLHRIIGDSLATQSQE